MDGPTVPVHMTSPLPAVMARGIIRKHTPSPIGSGELLIRFATPMGAYTLAPPSVYNPGGWSLHVGGKISVVVVIMSLDLVKVNIGVVCYSLKIPAKKATLHPLHY